MPTLYFALASLLVTCTCPLWGRALALVIRTCARRAKVLGSHTASMVPVVAVMGGLSACTAVPSTAIVPTTPKQPGFALYSCSEEHFDARYVGGMTHMLLTHAALDAPAPGRGTSDFDAERLDGGATPGKFIARGHIDGVAAAALVPVPGRFSQPSVQATASAVNGAAAAAANTALRMARQQAHAFAYDVLAHPISRSLPGGDYGACLIGAASFFLSHPDEQPYLYILGRLVPEGPQTPTAGVNLSGARVHLVFYCEQTVTCPDRLQAVKRLLSRMHAGGIHISYPEDLGTLSAPWKEQW